MNGMCPHCGYNLEADQPLVRGEWEIRTNMVKYAGTHIHFTPTIINLLYTVAKGEGRVVPTAVLYNRVVGDDVGDARNNLAVHLCKARKQISKMGVPFPIEVVHSLGLKWV